MRRNRNGLLAGLVIAFVVATSFSVILYSSNNPTLTIVKAESSTAHLPDSINGTFDIYLMVTVQSDVPHFYADAALWTERSLYHDYSILI